MASLEDQLGTRLDRPVEAAAKPDPPPAPSRPAQIYGEDNGGVLLSLDDASEGAGDILDLGLVLHRHTLQVNPLGRGVCGGRVVLQGSLDAERWHTMAYVNLEAGHHAFFAGSKMSGSVGDPIAFRYLRAVITERIIGGTVDAYVGA